MNKAFIFPNCDIKSVCLGDSLILLIYKEDSIFDYYGKLWVIASSMN